LDLRAVPQGNPQATVFIDRHPVGKAIRGREGSNQPTIRELSLVLAVAE
jgi:hypothetical protein